MKRIILPLMFFTIFGFSLNGQVTQLNNNNSLQVTIALNNNKTIVVSDIDSSIWVTDATPAGTIQISAVKFEDDWAVLSDKVIFRGSTPGTGSELYITDGTSGGTALLSDIVTGAVGSAPSDMVLMNGVVYFTAQTAAEGRELWKTDGTTLGTGIVKDIVPGSVSSLNIPGNILHSTGTYLLFPASNPTTGVELYKSDGTSAGTDILKDIHPTGSSSPQFFFDYNNLVLFIATDAATGQEIWKTDGTPGGTVRLKDIRTGPASATFGKILLLFPTEFQIFLGFHLFNNKLYFRANDGTSTGAGQVWSTDGTEANTVLLKDIIPNVSYANISLLGAINLPTKFIFPVSSEPNRSELWESDGTTAGTKLFKAFSGENELDPPFIPLNFGPLFQGDKFFFIGRTSALGRELWISNGSDSLPANTSMITDINTGSGSGFSAFFTPYVYTTSHLFFAADDGVNGNELWKSDGTLAGTSMVADINTGADSSNPLLPFFLLNGKIIFSATDGDDPEETDLYVVDGTFTPLPIKLAEFTVALKAEDALLQWTTLNEINSKEFIIQRSYDGRQFENIGTVPAKNTTAKHAYYFMDRNVSNSGKSIIYYRVSSADKDGKSETTSVIFVKLKGSNNWNVSLLSNPVQNFANVMVNGITGDLHLSIKDINGKVLYTNKRQNVNGQINIPVHNFQGGIYILVAETNNERKSVKFIKQ